MQIQVTNTTLYANVIDVDLCLAQPAFTKAFVGSVTIETAAGRKTFTGEHGASDYEEEYGFKIN